MIIYSRDRFPNNLFGNSNYLPNRYSHKGQNGKILVVGGSSLFHGAVIWAAEASSLLADMVHVASTTENNEIIRLIKTKWQKGIVISQSTIPEYAQEDDVILVGNGMMREGEVESQKSKVERLKWEEILKIKDEGQFTRDTTHYLIVNYPNKQFVFDAGALQMMDAKWLTKLHKKAVVTPHQKEFQRLFGEDLSEKSIEEKEQIVKKTANKYNCIILLKAVDDIVSDGVRVVRISGGNAGLTKGGTGDILAGLTAGWLRHGDALSSSVFGSYIMKRTADNLMAVKGYWYSVHDLLSELPFTLKETLIPQG